MVKVSPLSNTPIYHPSLRHPPSPLQRDGLKKINRRLFCISLGLH